MDAGVKNEVGRLMRVDELEHPTFANFSVLGDGKGKKGTKDQGIKEAGVDTFTSRGGKLQSATLYEVTR